MVSVRAPSLPAPSVPPTSPFLSFSLPRSLPFLSPRSLPFSFPPFFRCPGGGVRGRGAARSPRWGWLVLFAKPTSPLSLLSLPSFPYLFTLPTPFIRARCTPPPPRRSCRSQHLARQHLNPKLPQLRQGGGGGGMVRRMCAVCADNDDMTRRMLLRTRGQNRRGNGELILHRFLDDSRGLRLKLDKIRCLRLNYIN